MILVKDLVFEYPGVRALDEISFSIDAGNITAVVGPNGAGKSTMLRCLAGLDQPLSGSVTVAGIDVLEHPRMAHRKVGYLSDFFGLYDRLSVAQCLSYVAASHGVESSAIEAAVTRTATRLGLKDRLESRAGDLSRGLRQRVAIAQAIIHSPEILMLDEPASGLDPEARHALAELFITLRDEGMTLLVSSHILAELAEYSTEMLVIRHGRIIEHRSLSEVQTTGTCMYVSLSFEVPGLEEVLASSAGVAEVEVSGLSANFVFHGDVAARQALLKELVVRDLPVCAFAEQQINLQDSYLASVRAASS